jgi:pilus assembly protein CpaE
MQPDILNVSILNGTETPHPTLAKMIAALPQVHLMDHSASPEQLLKNLAGASPDLVMVYLDGSHALPDWLEALSLELPQTTLLVCSDHKEPDFLLEAMRLGVREVLPLPLNQPLVEAALARVRTVRKRLSTPQATRGKVLVVTGHKGGVGSTTVAVNLAVALSDAFSQRLVLVDLGRPYPDVSNFLDIQAPYTIADLIQNSSNLDNSFLQKTLYPWRDNLFVLQGFPDFEGQNSLNFEVLHQIFELLRGLHGLIIIDLSCWLDDIFFKVLAEADQVIFLAELTVPDIRNLKRLWNLMRDFEVVQGKVKLVINRNHKGNSLGVRDLEKIVKEGVWGSLPSDSVSLLGAINRGVPLAEAAPKSRFWMTLKKLAQQVGEEILHGEAAPARVRKRFLFF